MKRVGDFWSSYEGVGSNPTSDKNILVVVVFVSRCIRDVVSCDTYARRWLPSWTWHTLSAEMAMTVSTPEFRDPTKLQISVG